MDDILVGRAALAGKPLKNNYIILNPRNENETVFAVPNIQEKIAHLISQETFFAQNNEKQDKSDIIYILYTFELKYFID